jgi:hypothetical protein
MTATYISASGRARLEALQATLRDHLATDAGGRCVGCDGSEPCWQRAELTGAILAYGQLPRRRPGLTRAGLRRVYR